VKSGRKGKKGTEKKEGADEGKEGEVRKGRLEVRPPDVAHHNRVRASEGGPANSECSFCAELSCAACKGAQRTVSNGGGK
jgi:hypothetical protein